MSSNFDPILPCEQVEVVAVAATVVPQILSIKEPELEDGHKGKGMVYGERYTLEVESYLGDVEPKNKKQINWRFSYVSDNGEMIEEDLPKLKGAKIKFEVDDVEMLGRQVTFYAFIGNEKRNGANKSVWVHDRFKWLDKSKFLTDLQKRKNNALIIDQGGTNICGIAAPCYFFAKLSPDIYYKTVLSLFQKGIAIIPSTQYKIEVDSDEHLTKYTESDLSGLGISNADFVLLAVLRDQLNLIFDYDPANDGEYMDRFVANNFADEVEFLMKKLLNFQDTIKNADTVPVFSNWTSVEKSVNILNEKLDSGYSICLCINVGNIKDNKKATVTFPNHWVGLETVSFSEGIVCLGLYNWGDGVIKTYNIDANVFKDGYFGYVAGRTKNK